MQLMDLLYGNGISGIPKNYSFSIVQQYGYKKIKSCLFSTAEVTNDPGSLGGHRLVLRQKQTTKSVIYFHLIGDRVVRQII
jgi:hypothetical protein